MENQRKQFIKSYSLTQQTPLIHFQSDEEGATLRASEVKPKLDRFLVGRLGIEKIKQNGWFIGDTLALNYKMRFKVSGECSAEHPVCERDSKNRCNGIGCYFFTEQEPEKIKQSSFYKNIEMSIFCIDSNLSKKIEDLLCEFFAVHNFGFRQNKGFGSFIFGSVEDSRRYANQSGFYLSFGPSQSITSKLVLNGIKSFYQELKNGINIPSGLHAKYEPSFLMKTFFAGHLNEKKKMKLALLATKQFNLPGRHISGYDDDAATATRKVAQKETSKKQSEYIRGLLGFANFYTFRGVSLKEDPNKKFNLTFRVRCEGIERFSSPVLFKPIRDMDKYFVHIIFDNSALAKIADKEITLHCDCKNIDVIALKVNVPDNFLMSLMLDAFKSGRFKNLCYEEVAHHAE